MNPYNTIIARYYELFNSKTPLLINEEAEFHDICNTLLVFFLEVVILTSLQGASAGQRILKIQVLTWPDQDFVNPLRIMFRTLLICLVIPAVITDMQSRGLHDRFAKTVVVKN